mgnify:CR=1 FL=1
MELGKIMVVDDDKNICELLRLYLEKEGYQVVIANDGKEAVELNEKEDPELILLDIMLPQLSGMEVLRRLGKDIPQLDQSLCHIIASGMFNGLFEIVIHDMPREQAHRDVTQFRTFYTAGWLELMGQ